MQSAPGYDIKVTRYGSIIWKRGPLLYWRTVQSCGTNMISFTELGALLLFSQTVQSCGTKLWYKDDKLHGEDGPAIDDINSKRWYLNGQEVKGERLSRMMIKLRAKRMKSARS